MPRHATVTRIGDCFDAIKTLLAVLLCILIAAAAVWGLVGGAIALGAFIDLLRTEEAWR